MKKFIQLYKRFERFWHWSQALLIFTLIATGLEIHGLFSVLGFGKAVLVHNVAAVVWSFLLTLIFTWIFTTGEWKQYVPSFKDVDNVLRFYMYGVFIGEDHPHHSTPENKFNPLQRFTYIAVIFGLLPLQVITGFLFLFFPELREMGVIGSVDLIAIGHTFLAYSLVAFVMAHVYMITFGKKLSTHLKAMITGKEEL
ncbi:MAG: cytochrome b/b6 domain-containing protein [Bacteriovoracaceae bacterium]|nr:cytochrome b/b6 domain-containing protein [Bacteriovoracaceae bacterium]